MKVSHGFEFGIIDLQISDGSVIFLQSSRDLHKVS